eukprot:GAHX01005742.1.p1 GENE.GAHX01005742.1~~GAHX01005742.1.p1  ORF type:complete len:71 (+),score=13.83 GAHX01005742.1:126-338(+)
MDTHEFKQLQTNTTGYIPAQKTIQRQIDYLRTHMDLKIRSIQTAYTPIIAHIDENIKIHLDFKTIYENTG